MFGKVGIEIGVSDIVEIGYSFKDQVTNRCKCGRKVKLSINLAIYSKIRSKTYFSEQGKKEEKMGKE